MIPYPTWLSQILGYCHFVTDSVGVRRAWIDGDFTRTSVTDFDELYEQIFDDLDSDAFERELATYLVEDKRAIGALCSFFDAIRGADVARKKEAGLRNSKNLLRSEEWFLIVSAAEKVLAAFEGERH